jgi:hypothetical protein
MEFSPREVAEKIGSFKKVNIDENGASVTFLIHEKLYGAVPEPYPAHKDIPDWYKNIPLYQEKEDGRKNKNKYTLRGCRPFMQSLTLGWMLPLSSDLHLIHDEDGIRLNFANVGDITVIQNQPMTAYGDRENIPIDGAVGVKFETPWFASIPEDYYIINLPLLNRWEHETYKYFYPFSGIWDGDTLVTSLNHLALMKLPRGTDTVLKAGTPLAQLAIVHKNAFLYNGDTKAMTEKHKNILDKRDTLHSVKPHLYSDYLWNPINASRMINKEKEETSSCPFFK